MNPVNTAPSILVGTAGKTVWVRVEGKGSFLNSTGLKEFAKEMINRGHREFVIDLKSCPVMDSTFMGTLAGVALRLREIGQGQLRVVKLNERNRNLLSNLGLDQLFTIEGGDDGSPPAVEGGPSPSPQSPPPVEGVAVLPWKPASWIRRRRRKRCSKRMKIWHPIRRTRRSSRMCWSI
jgi:anti-anti-sigma factor